MISKLNDDLLKYQIVPFLEQEDIYSLYTVNKYLYKLINCYVIISPTIQCCEKYCFDENYRKSIDSKIGNKQLKLDIDFHINDYSILKNVHIIEFALFNQDINIKGTKTHTLLFENIKHINFINIGNVKNVKIYECENIENIHILGNLHSLELSRCNITDVSVLDNIKTLRINNCNNITDVSNLGKIHNLTITCCNGITDVSSLGNVYKLDLSYCYNITDVSALGNVHTLSLRGC